MSLQGKTLRVTGTISEAELASFAAELHIKPEDVTLEHIKESVNESRQENEPEIKVEIVD